MYTAAPVRGLQRDSQISRTGRVTPGPTPATVDVDGRFRLGQRWGGHGHQGRAQRREVRRRLARETAGGEAKCAAGGLDNPGQAADSAAFTKLNAAAGSVDLTQYCADLLAAFLI